MLDRARALIAQHADTTRLLGVDFMPIGRGNPAPASSHKPVTPAQEADPTEGLAFALRPMEGEADGGEDRSLTVAARSDPGGEDRSLTVAARSDPARPGQARSDAVGPVAPSRARACHQHLSDPRAKLDAVRACYEAEAPHRNFVTAHTNIVFGEGDPQARLMFVGEAPGEAEDQTGRPFVGRSGGLLEKMIVAMGLSREAVYICNVLKTRPPNNATPTPAEARLCAPYLIEQVRIVAPEVIVTLGLPAAHLLLETREPMRALRGVWRSFPPGRSANDPARGAMFDPDLPETPVMPTYHPAFLLRSYTEENRLKVWSDLKQVMDRLGLPGKA